jgi:putative glycosyltransferase (TIGR04348 family)
MGHTVLVEESWGGQDADLMIALHARRSHPSIARYSAAHPRRPLAVVLTGTDLYRDLKASEESASSLDLATRLVVLQEEGLAELEPRHRDKTHVIHQSAEPPSKGSRSDTHFEVCVVGHLREEKDPFRAALAARMRPEESSLRITQLGNPLDEKFATEARRLTDSEPRYRWLGEVPQWQVRGILSESHLLVQSSFLEGGANAISEALVSGTPVVASNIPGNVGMLGEDYPGYYPAGDTEALAHLLERAEADPYFYTLLEDLCATRSHLFLPEKERGALQFLLQDISSPSSTG